MLQFPEKDTLKRNIVLENITEKIERSIDSKLDIRQYSAFYQMVLVEKIQTLTKLVSNTK